MGLVDREGLKKFLDDNAKAPEMVPRAMELMEPFFTAAAADTYTLEEASDQIAAHAKEAISMATGLEVRRIVFVSKENPFPKPDWMSESVYEDSLRASPWASLQDSLQDSLRTSLGHSLWDSLRTSLWVSLQDSLWDSLRTSLGHSLWDSLRTSLGHSLGHSLWDSLWDSLRVSLRVSLRTSLWVSLRTSLWVSLFFYLCFTLVGDRENVERLTPLIQLLPHAIPLGEKKDEPGTWLVLCA